MRRWFLPETPDVLDMLRRQVEVTVEGIDALAGWAKGDLALADTVRDCEHRADEHKRELQQALVSAFTTPLEPEDLFALSRGLDWILNHAKDTVRESEVMGLPPDAAIAEMTALLADAVRSLAVACHELGAGGGEGAMAAADAAVKSERRLERVYRRAMAGLLEDSDVRRVTGMRELYRRISRLGDLVVDVAERVWYALVKEA
jgi:uncharacterized protein Yka (UPF0111/DUF47 family)